MTDPAAFLTALLLKLPALLVAVTLHELAHGLVADRLGDPTARRLGRLTLNPLPHIDPLGALAFVIAGFGWAKPVPVAARNFRHPVRDMAVVAAAGPAANFVIAFAGLVALALFRQSTGTGAPARAIDTMLFYIFTFNLGLAIFNLIPLPPLDGGHLLPYLLPRAMAPAIAAVQRAGPLLLLVLLVSGAAGRVLRPVFGWVSALYVAAVRALL